MNLTVSCGILASMLLISNMGNQQFKIREKAFQTLNIELKSTNGFNHALTLLAVKKARGFADLEIANRAQKLYASHRARFFNEYGCFRIYHLSLTPVTANLWDKALPKHLYPIVGVENTKPIASITVIRTDRFNLEDLTRIKSEYGVVRVEPGSVQELSFFNAY
jgi:hypothetical protein